MAMATLILPTATLTIWDSLMPYRNGAALNIPWAEAVRIGLGFIGEISLSETTTPGDWERVPLRRGLRVLMSQGKGKYHVRWGDPKEMAKYVGGAYHGYLLNRFEKTELDEIRSGWLEVFPGELKVYP